MSAVVKREAISSSIYTSPKVVSNSVEMVAFDDGFINLRWVERYGKGESWRWLEISGADTRRLLSAMETDSVTQHEILESAARIIRRHNEEKKVEFKRSLHSVS